MYDTTKVLNITKDMVLKHADEYSIFCQYLGFNPVVGQLYVSPLRKDNNPSFGLFYRRGNRTLLFKDFGTGETGDCFKFASLIDRTSQKTTLRNLFEQYVTKKITVRKATEIPVKKSKELDIIIDDIPFTEEGLNYWQQFGIGLATLHKFNVKQIKRFWVDGVEYWKDSKDKPMFSYTVYSKFKIYRPFYKQKRFYSNCRSIDIQGWEQLDYNKDTVFITKSLKDVMLLHELGYTAIAPNGEGHSIPEKALEILRKNFKHIVVLYDRDLPGMAGARKILNKNKDFDFMLTPEKSEKDLSDYYQKYGEEATIRLISKRLDHVKKRSKN